jgi:hypothetical protein
VGCIAPQKREDFSLFGFLYFNHFKVSYGLKLSWIKFLVGVKNMSRKDDFKEAAGFAAGGGTAGATIAVLVGNMGLAGAFGGIAIGAAPVVGAGVVFGMAAYGVKKLFDQGEE